MECQRHDPERLLAPADVDRGVDRDAAEPRRPAIHVTQPRQLAPGLCEGVLEGVLGVGGVAEYCQAQPERLGRFQMNQVHECVPVAGDGGQD